MIHKVPRKVVYDILTSMIRKEGIPSYVDVWERDLLPFHELPKYGRDEDFLVALSDWVVKKYHFHSHIVFDKVAPSWGKKSPLVKVINQNIGIVRFYACSLRYDRVADRKALDDQVHAVASAIRQWSKINGIIIDLRWHSGGDIYPFIVGLGSILRGVSLYSWGNVPATRMEKTWEIGMKLETGEFTTD